ncbi:MAG TPA: hypothetical protein VFK09_10900 [Gemmatimonadales bacterium]|nr:hypothetical protein [Gemmatimonadales bacterium]
MSSTTRLAAIALVAIVAACGERPSPTADTSDDARPDAARAALPQDPRARLESLARTVALALRDPSIRARLKADLDRSQAREHKLQFQTYVNGGAAPAGAALARAAGIGERGFRAEAAAAIPLELYLPVPAHRAAWAGGGEILVATQLHDHEAPVAFDTQGRRQVLSADSPPATPVLALVPQETDFSQAALVGPSEVCPYGGTGPIAAQTCGGGTTGGGSSPGLWMTYAAFTGTFEGWLKGSPEFEVHVLGQAGTSDSLRDYQCAGEKQAAPYFYDQNATSWSGNVLLFSQTQINNYKAAHPGNSMRVVVVEDDDGACQIKMDADRFRTALNTVDSVYRRLTAGRDTTAGLVRYWNRATAFQKILQAVWSVITTQDDYVGDAVQDAVAGEFRAGANWIVKGENNITTGALNLQMR